MTAEIVDLKAAREEELAYWRCDCGCITHYVRNDGEIECARCEIVASGNGFWKLPHGDVREERDDDGPEYTRKDLCDDEDALQSVLRFVKPEPSACVIVLKENGKLHVWGKSFKSRERRGWLRRRLDEARKMLIEQ